MGPVFVFEKSGRDIMAISTTSMDMDKIKIKNFGLKLFLLRNNNSICFDVSVTGDMVRFSQRKPKCIF